MTSTKNKPAIDISRFNELLNQNQEVKPFAQPEKVEIQSHSIVAIAPSRSAKKPEQVISQLRLDKEIYNLLEKHTAGSRNEVINILLRYAIEDLKNKNITIK